MQLISRSLRASSPFEGYREKYTRERHARGDATAGGGEEPAPCGFAARSLARSRAARFARPNKRACSQTRFHVLFNSVHLKRWPQEHVHVRSVSALYNTEIRSAVRS